MGPEQKQQTEKKVVVITADQQVQQQQQQAILQNPLEEAQQVQQANPLLTAVPENLMLKLKAVETAPGEPVQEMAPPKQSFKEKQRDKKALKAARKVNPDATIETCRMRTAVQEANQALQNTLNANQDLLKEKGVDGSLFAGFVQGYRAQKKGRPATAEDQNRMQSDSSLIADYCSTDQKTRYACLDRMLDQFFASPLLVGGLEPTYLRSHVSELKTCHQMNQSLRQILQDPNNRDYVQRMDPVRKQLLEQNQDLLGEMNTLLEQKFQAQGVQLETGAYVSQQEAAAAEKTAAATQQQLRQQAKTYQYQAAKETIRQLAFPVADYDIDALESLSDQELAEKAEELAELVKSVPIVMQQMRVPSPDADSERIRNGRARLAADSSLRSKQIEYLAKAPILQAMAKRASELKRGISGEDTEGARELQLAELRFQSGTSEFKTFSMIVSQAANRTQGQDVSHAHLNYFWREMQEKFNSNAPETADLKQRLQDHRYYSLDATREETLKKIDREDMGESLFRSFASFCELESTQALLDQKSFEQLVRDVGAGNGITKERLLELEKNRDQLLDAITQKQADGLEVTEAEQQQAKQAREEAAAYHQKWEEALHANQRGLSAIKTVMKAQYDMLSRKYGNHGTAIALREMTLHHQSVFQDFSNAQVELNLVDRIKDFLDPDDPSDQLLNYRVQYFSPLGNALRSHEQNCAGMEFFGYHSESELLDLLKFQVELDENSKQARDWLLEHDPDFNHQEIDWKAKIRTDAFPKPYSENNT